MYFSGESQSPGDRTRRCCDATLFVENDAMVIAPPGHQQCGLTEREFKEPSPGTAPDSGFVVVFGFYHVAVRGIRICLIGSSFLGSLRFS